LFLSLVSVPIVKSAKGVSLTSRAAQELEHPKLYYGLSTTPLIGKGGAVHASLHERPRGFALIFPQRRTILTIS